MIPRCIRDHFVVPTSADSNQGDRFQTMNPVCRLKPNQFAFGYWQKGSDSYTSELLNKCCKKTMRERTVWRHLSAGTNHPNRQICIKRRKKSTVSIRTKHLREWRPKVIHASGGSGQPPFPTAQTKRSTNHVGLPLVISSVIIYPCVPEIAG